jgi:trehalose 2-sulfotransferase
MPSSSYLVCATQRSGSTLLCEALKSTGVAGRPEEFFEARALTGCPRTAAGYFRQPGAPDIGDILGDPEKLGRAPEYSSLEAIDDYAQHLARSFRLGTTPNGVFGAKLMWGHLGDFAHFAGRLPAFRGLPIDELLPAVFPRPRYVWVTRRDKVRQAVSLWKAIQTEAWRGDDADARPEPAYHEAALEHLVKMLADHDTHWESFFSRAGIDPLVIAYEDDLSEGAERAVRRVLRHLDLSVPPGWHAPAHMRRQADERSERWVAQWARFSARRSRRRRRARVAARRS